MVKSLDKLIKFVGQLRKPKIKPSRIVRVKPFAKRAPRRKYKFLSPETKRVIAQLYLANDSNNKLFTYEKLGQMYNSSRSTVERIVNEFKTKGGAFINMRRLRYKMIPEAVQQQLIAPELLQEWAIYSLEERPALIQQRFGIRISRRTLYRFYHEKQIRYKQTKTVYRQ